MSRTTAIDPRPERSRGATHLDRRALLAAFAALPLATAPALAGERYRVVGVDVRPSAIVASRIITDLPGRIAARIGRSRDRGTPVRVIVELRTIDPYRGRVNERRGIAARYRVIDAATGRTLKADRFIERTTVRDDVEGTFGVLHVPRSQGAGERELADEVAGHVLRYGL